MGAWRSIQAGEGRLARLVRTRRLAGAFEQAPVPGTDLNDLSEVRLDRYFRDRFPDWSWPEDRGSTLVAHKLAVELNTGLTPTHLGLLLFAEQPERHMNGAFIDLAAYAHEDPDGNTIDTKRVVGPVPEQIAQAMAYIRLSPLVPMDYPSYAEKALQQAVVNAVVHRDYEITGFQIIIRMFPDRIEFQNPGTLYNTLTIENLYAGCHPVRRNQLLAGFMYDYKSALTGRSYMEARGEGFLNLVRDSLRLSGRRPELEQVGDATRLTIYAAHHEGVAQDKG